MNPDEQEELASLYVLGLLEGSELAAFERELSARPQLSALVAEMESASAFLATSLPRRPVPKALRDSVLRQARPHGELAAAKSAPGSPFSLSWVPWAIAAVLTVCCGLLWSERSRLSEAIGTFEKQNQSLSAKVAALDTERARLQDRLSALENEKSGLELRLASLEGRDLLREIQPIMLTAQAGGSGKAEVVALWDPQRREGALHLANLPEPAPGKDYQLWILTPESKQPLDAGVIPHGADCLNFSATQPVKRIAALAVSLEPKGGSLTPRGPVLYLGKL
jgi:anti-sigma-K factor RskA